MTYDEAIDYLHKEAVNICKKIRRPAKLDRMIIIKEIVLSLSHSFIVPCC